MQIMDLDPSSQHIQNSKSISIDLSIRAKTIKIIEENIEVILHDLGLGKGFLDLTLKSMSNKRKIK